MLLKALATLAVPHVLASSRTFAVEVSTTLFTTLPILLSILPVLLPRLSFLFLSIQFDSYLLDSTDLINLKPQYYCLHSF